MRLNELQPAEGSRRKAKRVGRGAASGNGKTAGRGQKGQHSRTGGGAAPGFEGGQMPIQRRLPKFGFASRKERFSDEVRLDSLSRLEVQTIDLAALKDAGLVSSRAERVKVIASGELSRAVTVKGISVTKGARAAIESAGGEIQD
jgi:large subunit ribosomal protein L15